MFRRKLLALDYHAAEKFNPYDENELRNVVIWLEDQKIRHLKIEDRSGLRDTGSLNWPQAFEQYLYNLACPIKSNSNEKLEWLLALAIKLEYSDNLELYNKNLDTGKEIGVPQVVSSNPLDDLDFNSPDFKKGVSSLAHMLKISVHPDHLVTLKACSKFISKRLTTETLSNPDNFIIKGKPFPIQESDLGFDTGDYVLNQGAKVLRLLYIQDLRELQTRINECIVGVQSVTANPKTDTSLGKVGK